MRAGGSTSARQTNMRLIRVECADDTIGEAGSASDNVTLRRADLIWASSRRVTSLMPIVRCCKMGGAVVH